MTLSGWRVVGASATGASHIAAGGTCQDGYRFTTAGRPGHHPALLIAAADGAGSAPCSALGAEIAINSFIENVAASLVDEPVDALAAAARSWLTNMRMALHARAERDARAVADYACTFMGAVLGDDHAILVQIGDGIIAYRTGLGAPWAPATWPQTGEYRNSTYFITDDDAMERVSIRFVAEPVLQIAVSTDGLTDLCLDQALRLIHQPFFDSLLQTFDAAGATLEEDKIGAALSRFLESPQVASQSDDDKTLVLASRALIPAPVPPP